MTTYEVVGMVAAPFTLLEGRQIGDVIQADADDEMAAYLVRVGALRVVAETQKEAPKSEPEPEPEPAPEPEPEPAKAAPPRPAPERRHPQARGRPAKR
jgi:hypothetical protein